MKTSFLLAVIVTLVSCAVGSTRVAQHVQLWQQDGDVQSHVVSYDLPDYPRFQAARCAAIPSNLMWTAASGDAVTLVYTDATVPPLTSFRQTLHRLDGMSLYLLSGADDETPYTLYLIKAGNPMTAYVYRDPVAFRSSSPHRCVPTGLLFATPSSEGCRFTRCEGATRGGADSSPRAVASTSVAFHARDIPAGTLRAIERGLEPALGLKWLTR